MIVEVEETDLDLFESRVRRVIEGLPISWDGLLQNVAVHSEHSSTGGTASQCADQGEDLP